MKELTNFIKDILFAILIALIIMYFVQPAQIHGTSMFPTFKDGEFIIINKNAYKEIERGEIVVVSTNIDGGKMLIKRLIGKGGDHIVISNGNVYVNDELQNEYYLNEGATVGTVDIVVDEDEYYIMGDNRGHSNDSRLLGTIMKKDIVGKVFLRFYPLTQFKYFT